MARLIKKAKQYGFTLVELLIVVAIIGVLSTIGIPSFRRMVQKSKKSEAKVNLGGLYTAEQAFFSEYGAFGNNVNKIGFQVDGNSKNLMYSVGFFGAAACTGLAAIQPPAASALGGAITQAFPQYYAGFAATDTRITNGVMTTGCDPIAGIAGFGATYGGAPAVNDVYNSGAAQQSDRFVALAYGVISPNVSKTAPVAGATDVWGVSQARLISNIRDGVN